jgi:hypothetical protein
MGARAGRWIIEIFIVLMLLISLFNLFKTPYAPPPPGLAFSEFLGDVDQGKTSPFSATASSPDTRTAMAARPTYPAILVWCVN